MKIYNISDMVRGWFVGDFVPSAYQTKNFEVGYLKHNKGENWEDHYHKECKEINLLVKGKMSVNNTEILPGNIFVLEEYEFSSTIFLDNCELVVIKTNSNPKDKFYDISNTD